eukprot:355166-Chlamydomonas_euryale.AAC.7
MGRRATHGAPCMAMFVVLLVLVVVVVALVVMVVVAVVDICQMEQVLSLLLTLWLEPWGAELAVLASHDALCVAEACEWVECMNGGGKLEEGWWKARGKVVEGLNNRGGRLEEGWWKA